MTPVQKRALQYVKNTGLGATIDIFIEDHAPIGERLWDDLDMADTVGVNEEDKIYLLPKGEELLNDQP